MSSVENSPSGPLDDCDDNQFAKSYDVLTNGFATPHSAKGIPGTISGCLYDSTGNKVSRSERFGGHHGDLMRTENPDRYQLPDKKVERLAGRSLYLGHYMGGHYGHFITETLSSFWIFEEKSQNEFDHFVFHPFVFGEEIPNYAQFCFDQFGINSDKVIFIKDFEIQFDEIIVPERLFRLNHSADQRLHWVYQHISRDVLSPTSSRERLYLSRRKLSWKNYERVIANEVRIERFFRKHNFRIVYPEEIDFKKQICLYRNAEMVAGITGSALHNSLFMERDSKVIELGDARYGLLMSPTQTLCNEISGVTGIVVPFSGITFGIKEARIFDVGYIAKSLITRCRIISSNGAGEPYARLPLVWLIDTIEILYLLVRPSLGTMVRKVIRRSK